jgi:hypothetical protein
MNATIEPPEKKSAPLEFAPLPEQRQGRLRQWYPAMIFTAKLLVFVFLILGAVYCGLAILFTRIGC